MNTVDNQLPFVFKASNINKIQKRNATVDSDFTDSSLNGVDLGGRNTSLNWNLLKNNNLADFDFSNANLSLAILRGANLKGANLCLAILRGTDLQDADLQGAILSGSILQGANLQEANLSNAYLLGSNLSHAVLSDANLATLIYSVQISPIPIFVALQLIMLDLDGIQVFLRR